VIVRIHKKARKYLGRLPAHDRERIEAAIRGLPDTGDIQPYVGAPGVFRLKVNTYRVLYTLEDDMLHVVYVEPRGQAYTRKTQGKRG